MYSKGKYVSRYTIRFDEKRESDFRFWWKEVDLSHRKYKSESDALRAYLTYKDQRIKELEEQLEEYRVRIFNGEAQMEAPAEKKLFEKALGLPFLYGKCIYAIPIQGNPKVRICTNPRKGFAYWDAKRHRYIVDDPRICGKCSFLGYNEEKKPQAKSKPKPRPKKPTKEPFINPRLNFELGENEGLPHN